MATDLSTIFPAGKINPPSGAYPTGSIKDETVPGSSDDGTPLDEKWGNDFEGFKQAVMLEAGIDISGSTTSDTALLSQILLGLKAVVPTVDKKDWPTMANAADADHDITFSSGKIPASDGSIILTTSADQTKQIDAAWAAGDNAGGIVGGAVAINTTYHCHRIRKDSDGSIDHIFDPSPVAANIPAGYTAYRRIGSVVTDSSANIIAFVQRGDVFQLTEYAVDVNTTTPGTSGNLATLTAPQGLTTLRVIVGCDLFEGAVPARVSVKSTDMVDSAVNSSTQDLQTDSTGAFAQVNKDVVLDSNGQIRYRSSASPLSALRIKTHGWIDPRIE
jgi:hypothetical protein